MDSAWREITRASASKANVKKRAFNRVPLFSFIPRRDELSSGT
jgi:hypothetical protein